MTLTASPRQTDLLRDLIASGQAATDAKLEAIYRAVEMAQADAREARDTAKETAVIIREQNVLARVADLRGRVEALEVIRSEGQGMARGARLLLQVGKLAGAAGGGALALKLFGG